MKLTRPVCPDCGMNMIVAAGFALPPEERRHECLRCGRVEAPGADSTEIGFSSAKSRETRFGRVAAARG